MITHDIIGNDLQVVILTLAAAGSRRRCSGGKGSSGGEQENRRELKDRKESYLCVLSDLRG
jgi:hypothetical protein